MKNELDEYAVTGRAALFYTVIGVVLVAAIVTFFAWLRPMWLDMEREAFVESHQYVEARKTEITTNVQKYDELQVRIEQNRGNERVVEALQAQQHSLKKKIQLAMSKIPEDQWPENTRRFQ